MSCKFIQVITTLMVLGLNYQYCSAQAACNGVLTGTFNNGVVCVVGNNCTLDGATVFGNVLCSSGRLLAVGNSLITGNVQINDQVTRVELDAVTVLGAVQVADINVLNELIITELANVGPVTVSNAPNAEVKVSGELQSLDLDNSGNLIANNLLTNASVSIKASNGFIVICGSFLGGLLVDQHTGDIEINANVPNCGPTVIVGGLIASRGSGQVRVIGADLPSGDFIVSEYTGDISLQNIPTVSDIMSQQNSGSLTISNLTADSDTSIISQVGSIALQELVLNGDFTVAEVNGNINATDITTTGDLSITKVDGNITVEELNTAGDFLITEVDGRVVLQDSMFSFEDVSVIGVSETVEIIRNSDFSLTAEEIRGEVMVIDNNITNGKINKNTGGVVINNNVFAFLSCTDNVPAPIGNGNSISFGDGQCSSGL